MPPPTEHSLQSVLQGVPPEDRRAALIAALCSELEGAIQMREKAIARFDNLHEDRQKQSVAMIEEMQVLVRYRDEAVAQLAAAREEHRRELEASRLALDGALKERDNLAQRMAESEAAYQKQLKAQSRPPTAKARSAEQETLRKERDAYKEAADKLLEERIEALKERNRIAAELESASKAHLEQLAELREQRDRADAALQQERKNYHQELAALSSERDRLASGSHTANGARPSEAYEQEIAFIARERDAAARRCDQLQSALDLEKQARAEVVSSLREEIGKLTKDRNALSEELAQAQAGLSRQLADLTVAHGKTKSERDDLSARLERVIEESQRSVNRLGEEKDTAVQGRNELEAHLHQLRADHEQRLLLLTQERDGLLEARDAIAELRETHHRDLQEFDAQREHYQKEIKSLNAQRAEVADERDKLASQLEAQQTSTQQSAEALIQERDELRLARQELTAELTLLREDRARQIQALTAQNARLAAERSAVTADLGQEQSAHAQEVEGLRQERDALLAARDALAAEFAKVGQQQTGDIEKLSAQHHELTGERNRIAAELMQVREEFARKVEVLSRERDAMQTSRDEMRVSLDEAVKAHRRDQDAWKQENGALVSEREATQMLLEQDRLAWRKQVAFFTKERATLAQERDESLVAATQREQTRSRQLELRIQECEILVEQRAEMIAQLNELREAQKRQSELFGEERRILAHERDALAARLEQALKSLGIDRTNLLAQKQDALCRLEAATAAHREELAAITEERNAYAGERDELNAQLVPFREAREREMATLGTLVARKHQEEPANGNDSHRVRDTVADREVDIAIVSDANVSEAAKQQLIEEARRLGRLQHPNIPPVYEVGMDEFGRPYYTLRKVRGVSLRAVLDQLENAKVKTSLHFTLKRMLGVFHKACDAVAFAHANGVTHGALGAEQIILGDFGEVLVTQWNQRSRSILPREGQTGIDEQADIMALGRLLYEIVTLEPVVDSGRVRPEIPPGKRPLGEHGNRSQQWAGDTSVSPLIKAARRAFDRRVADQFLSVKELQMRVDAFKDTFDDPAHLTLRRLFWRWLRAHKLVLMLLLVLVAGAVTAGFLFLAERNRIERIEPTKVSVPARWDDFAFPPSAD